MIKKILLVLVSVLVFVSCSNKATSPDNSNSGVTDPTTPPTGPTEEELLIKKYGIDISQEDAVISQKIEENLKAYFAEKNSYRVILTGTPKDYSKDGVESLASLIYEAAVKINVSSVDVDIKNIDFKNGAIESHMFAEGSSSQETFTLNLIFPENKITTIKSLAFYSLNSLKEIVIPDSVTTIESEAFYFCSQLNKLTLSKNLKTIGNSAFLYAQALKELVIPNSVTSIGDQAFGDIGIQKLQLSSSLESIGMGAFTPLEVTELTIPASVKSIGYYAFGNSQNLTTVIYYGTSPNTINNNDALSECLKLTTLIIPNAKNPDDPDWKNFLGGNFTDIRKQ
ncbi:leucine-rich repeat domain-containing protein [Brachyspira intermedia]|uniref:leucine-rich repeat domain-containing protein n=1 Tax=Brachyspira intermedia TaxID=84377 RepID=UPI0030067803